MANSKMVRFALCCTIFSILGAIASANFGQSIGQSQSNLRSQGAVLFPSVLDDIDLENGPTALDDLSSILGLPKPEPKPMKIVSPKKVNKIDYSSSDDLAARIAGVPSSSLSGESSQSNQVDAIKNDIHDPLDDKIAEFLSCWDSVPSAVKQGLSDQKQSDFKKFSEYVRDLHLRSPSSYYSLDVSQAHHLALESNFFLGECMSLDKKESDLIVEDGEYETLDKKIVEFLTCWNDLPAEYKNTLPAFKLSNHDTMAKYVEKIHSQIISKEKLDKSAVDNLEWGMSVHIDKCHELEAHRILNLSADF